MSAATIISAATGLLTVLTEIAKLSGEDDAEEGLRLALAALRTRRTDFDAVHAATDAKLEELRRRESSVEGQAADVYEEHPK